MLKHWRKRIGEHFNRFRQESIATKNASAEYKKRKKYIGIHGPATDLVKTGKTKTQMTSVRPTVRVSGRTAKGIERMGRMLLKWPRGHKQKAGATGVTKQVMASEIRRFTNREERDAAIDVRDFYVERIKRLMEYHPRVRKRLAARLRAIGAD